MNKAIPGKSNPKKPKVSEITCLPPMTVGGETYLLDSGLVLLGHPLLGLEHSVPLPSRNCFFLLISATAALTIADQQWTDLARVNWPAVDCPELT